MQRFILLLLIAAVFAWSPVGPGIEYHYERLSDPNDVFIIRIDKTNPHPIIETMVADEKVKGAREKTTSLYHRYNDSLTAWPNGVYEGARYKAIAAVNGYYFDMKTGEWISGGLSNGWYVHRFDDKHKAEGHGAGYAYRYDRSMFIGECVNHPNEKNYILFPKEGKTKFFLNGINKPMVKGALFLYTPQWDTTTQGAGTTVEIVVKLEKPLGISNSNKKATGIVKAVRSKKENTVIEFDEVVIAAEGDRGVKLLEIVKEGFEIEIYQDMDNFDDKTCSKPITDIPWQNTFSSLGGAFHYLKKGTRMIYKDTIRHPRTAMAYNDKYFYFFVVDGRTSKSRGMYIDEISAFAQKFLNATDGIALDGGGSSTLVINGKIMNFPSDGVERSVSNAVLFAIAEPKSFSSKHKVGESVVTTAAANLRTGPGTNFHEIEQLTAKKEGVIEDHKLKGVFAKGSHWWRVNFGGKIGWVAESLIAKK